MSTIPWLDPQDIVFPKLAKALEEPNGLLAAGGDLSVSTLLSAYRQGIFPWFSEGEPILWWSPSPRMVFTPGKLKISKSLAKVRRQGKFRVSYDEAFAQVIEGCAAPRRDSEDTWISPQIIEAYQQLHQQGYAHSVECWLGQRLVGGLYGIALDGVFFGESMFSCVSNASKVALACLDERLQQADFKLIDCQVQNPHLDSLGAYTIAREDFLLNLNQFISNERDPRQRWVDSKDQTKR